MDADRSFESSFVDGKACKVNHVSQSEFCKVVIDGQEEYWVSHGLGVAVGGKLLPTEDSWRPTQNPCRKPPTNRL